MNSNLPVARRDSLIIKELADETLVYDLETDKAHCLNLTAARVWKNCNGRRTLAQLRVLIEKETGCAVPEEMIWLALDQLEQFSLLEAPVARPKLLLSTSRRQMVRLVGTAAIALPIITSIVAPGAAQAASIVCCQNSPQCPPGMNCNVPDANCGALPKHCS